MVSLLGGSELPKEANQLTLPDDSTIPEERASLTSSHAAVPFIEDETSIVLMQQEMQDLKKQMSILSLSGSSFSEDDRCIIYMMLAQHKQNQILLIERETIRNTPTHEAYYGDIQRRFSALMVAAQGIGAGYIDVSNSTTATVSGWAIGAIAAAISIAFPGILAANRRNFRTFIDHSTTFDSVQNNFAYNFIKINEFLIRKNKMPLKMYVMPSHGRNFPQHG